jgi:integrase/recombinase XerD
VSSDPGPAADIVVYPLDAPAAAGEHPILRHTRGWLAAQQSGHTRNAYRRDVLGINEAGEAIVMRSPAWLPWCDQIGLHPFAATISDVNEYGERLAEAGLAPASRARKLSAISSWYAYMVKAEQADRNPAGDSARPFVDRLISPAVGLSEAEVEAIFTRAAGDGLRSLALLAILYFGGFRIGSVLEADIGDLGWNEGRRTLKLALKGGAVSRDTLEEPASRALEAYLDSRGELADDDPVFVNERGRRMNEAYVWRLVRRLARESGVRSWKQINPHTWRHVFTTHALDVGVALAVVSASLHHRSIQTTLRYDRARESRIGAGAALAERYGHLVPGSTAPPSANGE